jgi:xylulokinase
MLMMLMAKYMALDSSTQSLSALIIDTETGAVCANQSVVFGERLPQYHSPKGFHPRVRHSDPLMWVEALELILGDLVKAGVDLASVRGVSGAGRQHGSVYLARSFDTVGAWSTDRPLCDQVQPLLSRRTSPIWMDSATSAECAEIAGDVGGDERVVAITRSRAIERFTGPQIRKFHKDSPAEWARTCEIHLVSSFMASLLTAASAPIDLGDGAGMNLLDVGAGNWSRELLDATAPGLQQKLRAPVPCATRVGVPADYFVKEYGFAPDTPVIAFTGDNPSSLVGMGASRPGTAVISLGTSDTVFAAMAAPRTDPLGYGHVFGTPAGGFMACTSNGSLAREVRRFGLSWDDFAAAIAEQTKAGNNGNILLPYSVPNITPRAFKAPPRGFGSKAFVAGQDGAAARAVAEAQAPSMRLHLDLIGKATPGPSMLRGKSS